MPTDPQAHHLLLNSPATDWRDGLPTGNGSIGAIHFGNVYQDRVLLNHENLWAGGLSPEEVPELRHLLPKLREMLRKGQYAEANELFPNVMTQNNEYVEPYYQPLGELFIQLEFEDAFRNYSRRLDMSTGEIITEWSDGDRHFKKRVFVSRVNDLVGFRLECSQVGGINGEIGLGPFALNAAFSRDCSKMRPKIKHSTEVHGTILAYHGIQMVEESRFAHPAKKFGALALLKMEGGQCQAQSGKLGVANCDALTVWIKVYAGDLFDLEVVISEESFGKLGSYDSELSAHVHHHREIFMRQKLDLNGQNERSKSNETLLLEAAQGHLPIALAEKMFNYGRYLLICSSRSGGMPAHLQGVWNGEYDPPWCSFYMNNENVQMNYWPALPGNMRETTEAYFEYYESRLSDFQANAQRIFGCRGINVPAFSGEHGGLNRNIYPHCLYWTGAAGWLAALFYDYWLFTGDKDFLKKRAVPFMREVALFYQDFFVEDSEGKYVSMPSNSPENVPTQHEIRKSGEMDGKRISIAINATMDFAIAKEVLTNLIEASRVLNEFNEEVSVWEGMLEKIPSYEVNEDGALKEWLHPDFKDNYQHRHESHIYPLFPGFEIDKRNSPELFEACRIALDMRKCIGLKDQTGWSLAHMANARARLGEGDKAHRALEILAQTCIGINFFTYHNDYRNMGPTVSVAWGFRPPFQIDANFGWTAAILEMLAFSRPGFVGVLPALPQAWNKGHIEGLCCRGGITLAIEWDLAAHFFKADFVSQWNQTIEVSILGSDAVQFLELRAGEKRTVTQ